MKHRKDPFALMYIDYTFTAQELTEKVGNSHPRFLVAIDTPASMGERDEFWPKPGSRFQLTALILFNDFVG